MKHKSINWSLINQRNIYYTTILSHVITSDGKYMFAAVKRGKLAMFSMDSVLRHNADTTDTNTTTTTTESKRALQLVDTNTPIYSLALRSDNDLICGGNGSLSAWKFTSSGSELCKQWSIALPKNDIAINDMVYSSNNNTIICGCGDNNIYAFDVESSKPLFSFDEHSDYINCLSLSNDTNTLYSGSEDGSVRVWDLRTNKSVHCLQPFTNSALCRTNYGKWIGGLDVLCDDWLVCGGGPHLSLWHLRSMSVANTLQSHQTWNVVEFTSNDHYILSGGNTPFLSVWTINGQLVSRIETSTPNIFSVNCHEFDDNNDCYEFGVKQLITTAGTSYKINICTNWKYKDFELFVM